MDENFDKINPIEQGGITYLKFFLEENFCMMNDFVTSFQKPLKTFTEEGSSKKVGENVLEAAAQIKVDSERL